MRSEVKSIGLLGIEGFVVDVESDVAKGMPSFDIVGLPDAAVKESKERVRLALKNIEFPTTGLKIALNLAPGDVRKEGPVYDLPILLSILAADGRFCEEELRDAVFLGELAFDGSVRRIKGAFAMALCALESGFKRIFVPEESAAEASAVEGIEVYGAKHVEEILRHLSGGEKIERSVFRKKRGKAPAPSLDFCDVKGQETVKRALEIAAAGMHNLLLVGPPGAGKSMLAKRIPSILPEMDFKESVETSRIHSIAGTSAFEDGVITVRPFRAPHHSASAAALAGGGRIPGPGEISLAHNGVLFLDELPEFHRDAIEILRQPLEDGFVTVSRIAGTLSYPADFMLVCAMNPCKCGYLGHPDKKCTCTPVEVQKYLYKISGPLLDRIDLHVEVPAVQFEKMASKTRAEESKAIRARVEKAREIQRERYRDLKKKYNARLERRDTETYCELDAEGREVLKAAFARLSLSARAYDKILKVARTIADLEGSEKISVYHVTEAISYRGLDRR